MRQEEEAVTGNVTQQAGCGAGRIKPLFLLVAMLLALSGLSGGMVPAQAEPCAYYVAFLPRFEGVVTRVTGEGVLLEDGTELLMPDPLMPYMHLGQNLNGYGLKAKTGRKFWVLALIPSSLSDSSHGKTGDMKRRGNEAEPVCPSLADVKKGPYPGSPAYDIIPESGPASPDPKETDRQP